MRRKLIEFDDETWQAIDLLARDSMKTWQELAEEALRDLLKKHGRPTDLRTALKQSMRASEANKPTPKPAASRKGRT
jgi:predicted transcriptional regulator